MTRIFCEREILKGAQIIRDKGTVAFRTETVYGLGADATCDHAVKKIFSAKSRPQTNPLIVHFFGIKHVMEYLDVPKDVLPLFKIKALTVVMPNRTDSRISPVALGGQATVAVRIPSCAFSRRFIKACKVPIAAPSANTSGRPSPTRWCDVFDDLNGKVDAIFKGKQTKIGVESTVVMYTGGELCILRKGGVSQKMLEKKTGLFVSVATDKEKLEKSPGTRFKHYSPNVPLISGEFPNGYDNMVVLCRSQNKRKYNGEVIVLGKTAKQVQANLFAAFREAERVLANKPNAVIYIEPMPETQDFASVNERIAKACEKP